MEAIRYEIQCRFCARRIDGDSARDAMFNIAEHDIDHPTCGRCRETRITYRGNTLCDDCHNDTMVAEAYDRTLDAPPLEEEFA